MGKIWLINSKEASETKILSKDQGELRPARWHWADNFIVIKRKGRAEVKSTDQEGTKKVHVHNSFLTGSLSNKRRRWGL